jgi:hypothetical protein
MLRFYYFRIQIEINIIQPANLMEQSLLSDIIKLCQNLS